MKLLKCACCAPRRWARRVRQTVAARAVRTASSTLFPIPREKRAIPSLPRRSRKDAAVLLTADHFRGVSSSSVVRAKKTTQKWLTGGARRCPWTTACATTSACSALPSARHVRVSERLASDVQSSRAAWPTSRHPTRPDDDKTHVDTHPGGCTLALSVATRCERLLQQTHPPRRTRTHPASRCVGGSSRLEFRTVTSIRPRRSMRDETLMTPLVSCSSRVNPSSDGWSGASGSTARSSRR